MPAADPFSVKPGGGTTIPVRPGIVVPAGQSTRAFVFDGPATFPYLGFLNRNTTIEREGFLIHEGMTVRIAEDGSFEIEFVATAPAMPVTVGLQIPFRVDGKAGTITLPPIRLNTTRLDRLDPDPTTYRVVHKGRHSLLARAFIERTNGQAVVFDELSRRGTARFGSGSPSSSPFVE